jgi:hypothetical protein
MDSVGFLNCMSGAGKINNAGAIFDFDFGICVLLEDRELIVLLRPVFLGHLRPYKDRVKVIDTLLVIQYF